MTRNACPRPTGCRIAHPRAIVLKGSGCLCEAVEYLCDTAVQTPAPQRCRRCVTLPFCIRASRFGLRRHRAARQPGAMPTGGWPRRLPMGVDSGLRAVLSHGRTSSYRREKAQQPRLSHTSRVHHAKGARASGNRRELFGRMSDRAGGVIAPSPPVIRCWPARQQPTRSTADRKLFHVSGGRFSHRVSSPGGQAPTRSSCRRGEGFPAPPRPARDGPARARSGSPIASPADPRNGWRAAPAPGADRPPQ